MLYYQIDNFILSNEPHERYRLKRKSRFARYLPRKIDMKFASEGKFPLCISLIQKREEEEMEQQREEEMELQMEEMEEKEETESPQMEKKEATAESPRMEEKEAMAE